MTDSPLVTILDGGLSTALEQQGTVVDGALWTARLLADEPERVVRAHRAYFDAGAQIATAATYQASEAGFRAAGFDAEDARELVARGVTVARAARDLSDNPASLRVAASVGPYGAVLGDGSEYRGRYGVSAAKLRDFHGPRLETLAAAGPDLLAVETIPDIDEAVALVGLLDDFGIPAWFSYSIRREETCAGQPLSEAYAAIAGCSALIAAGVNCSHDVDVLAAVKTVVRETGLPAIAYPNRGGVWDPLTKTWSQQHPFDFDLVDAWITAGATYIGGCCGYGPSDIEALSRRVAGRSSQCGT